jgi:hypothetical protein
MAKKSKSNNTKPPMVRAISIGSNGKTDGVYRKQIDAIPIQR